MINLITGKTGNGKSLYAITEIEKRRIKENRPVFYNGIPDVKLDWTYFDDAKEWHKLPQGAIIVLDEAGEFFPPRSNTSSVPEAVHAFSIHRKQSHDVYIITQHPTYLDSYIRKIVDVHFHLVRVFGKETSKVHKFTTVKDNCDKDRSGSIEVTDFNFPKENYDKYRSIDGDTHTIKADVPFKYYLRYLIPVVIVVLVIIAYKSFSSAIHSGEETAIKEKQKLESPLDAMTNNRGNQNNEDDPNYWYVQNTPRISTLPHTAPKYDKVTDPVTAPIPAACIASRSKCICYSQQGTKLATDEMFCRQVAANGFFVDFQDNKNAKPNPPAEPAIKQPETVDAPFTVASNSSMGDGVQPHVDQRPARVNLNLPPQDASLRFQY